MPQCPAFRLGNRVFARPAEAFRCRRFNFAVFDGICSVVSAWKFRDEHIFRLHQCHPSRRKYQVCYVVSGSDGGYKPCARPDIHLYFRLGREGCGRCNFYFADCECGSWSVVFPPKQEEGSVAVVPRLFQVAEAQGSGRDFGSWFGIVRKAAGALIDIHCA